MEISSYKRFLSLMKTGYPGSTLFKILARCLRFPVSRLPGNLLALQWVSTICVIGTNIQNLYVQLEMLNGCFCVSLMSKQCFSWVGAFASYMRVVNLLLVKPSWASHGSH